MIDLSSSSGAIRLSPADFDDLVEAARHGGPAGPGPAGRDPGGRDPAGRGPGGRPGVAEALADDRLHGMLNVIADPAVEMRLVVAGPATRVEHRGWLAGDALVLLLGVRPQLLQLMTTDRAFLTATLVRLTRMRPRHLPERRPAEFPAGRLDELVSTDPPLRALALDHAGADFAWRLDLSGEAGHRTLTAVDGELGLRFAYPEQGRLVPVTNTFAYRVLSTVLAPV